MVVCQSLEIRYSSFLRVIIFVLLFITVKVPAGVLFFGPPGCGKTLLAKALANQSGANFISVKGPELLNMFVGESESRVRQVFSRARASAPCTIFFDELDALCPKRSSDGGGNQVTERVVNQLLTELDGLDARKDVYVIAATNRLELIDDAMLRPGRLGKLLYVPLPTPDDRVGILRALARKVSVDLVDASKPATLDAVGGNQEADQLEKVDIAKIARDHRADGFTGADMAALLREAGLAVMRELMDSEAALQQQKQPYERRRKLSCSESGCDLVDLAGNDEAATSSGAGGSGGAGSSSGSTKTYTTGVSHNSGSGGGAVISSSSLDEEAPFVAPKIQRRHFEVAFSKVRPSVSAQDRFRYDFARSRRFRY